ncbi:MAG TPA: histidine kinase [Candidatus Choladousia intestinigallinarum]|nr:histidine kinase [Candidatus Choladousia intestinigallinarum]
MNKRFFYNLSIRNKFFFTSAVLLISVSLFLAIFSSHTLRKNSTKEILENYDTIMEQAGNNTENIFSSVSSLSRVIAPNQWIQEYYLERNNEYNTVEQKALIKSFLDTIIEPYGIISSITIYGLDGRIVSSALNKQNGNSKITDMDFFNEQVLALKNNWGTTLYLPPRSSVSQDENGSENVIAVLKPIISTASGNLVAVLEVNILESAISGSIAAMYPSDGAEVFITDSSGVITSSPSKEKISTSIAGTELYPLLEKSSSSESFNQFITDGGKEYLVCIRKFSGLDWYVISKIPTGALYEQSTQQLVTIAVITCLALFITIPVSFSLANTISRPIKTLCSCMDQAAEGNLNVSIPDLGHNEIGTLSYRFKNMLEQISSLISQITKEKLARRENQLLALQAQINPHFLYNTLESISSLISLKLYDDAVLMTRSLEIFYKTALSGGKNVIPLEKEIQNVETYLKILKFRYRTMFDYQIALPSELKHYVITKLTIQPLVENSIYHGIRRQDKTGFISVSCRLCENGIEIRVTDNGPGFDQNMIDTVFNSPSSSYGLFNVNERIQLYFGPAYGLSIDRDNPCGACVRIHIPAVTASTEATIQLRK